jgi:hypothetical protein
MSNTTTETMALTADEIDPTKIILSERKTKVWNWREGNELKSRSQHFAEVYYGEPGQKLVLLVKDARTNGIKTSAKFKSAFMSLNLSDEQSNTLKTNVDNVILMKAYNNRHSLMPSKANVINDPAVMKVLYNGIVKAGRPKDEPGPNGETEYWQDQITASVPTKRRSKEIAVDDSLCLVEDLDGRPFDWNQIERMVLPEVAVEVEQLVFSADAVKAKCRYRLLVTPEKATASITTRRRLEQKEDAERVVRRPPNDACALDSPPLKKYRPAEAAQGSAESEPPLKKYKPADSSSPPRDE